MTSGFNAIVQFVRRNSTTIQLKRQNSATRKSIVDPTIPPLYKTFPQEPTNGVLTSGLPEIALSEVAQHDHYNDCWIVIYDRVYDVTKFMHLHPGGEQIILEYAGRDATLAFQGTGHSQSANEQLVEYLVGELPVKERFFRNCNSKELIIGVPQ
ncbi:uncharacterized protein [Eurosta solidaginis]|uniref:uncharacterized protein n=1 Tax=Eurosta solidaginis TaxID=178769 RepID=UPI00353166FA